MAPNYGEIICNAVDEIVTSKLQGLQYDITKLCTIVDDSASYQGKYIISDGTARYEAFTTDVSLKKGNQVQVMIPNGDYNMQKTIIGRIAATDTTPFNYVSPLDTMIKITNNIFDDARTIYGENMGLLANGPIQMIGPIYTLDGRNELAGYTRLGLSTGFRSWLNGLDVASGSYGLKVLIYTDIITEASGSSTNQIVYELTFNSADMIGNPYQFEDYFIQEKVFDISNINNIKQIEVYFYQDSNFKDSLDQKIPYQDIDDILGETIKPNNLFTNDVKMFLGYAADAFTEETLMLYTPNTLSYSYKRDELKEINLRWIHKIDEKTFEVLNAQNFDNDKYEIHWFKYNPGYEKINQYAGKDWEEIQTGDFTYYLTPEVKNQTERIKVIGIIKADNIPYYSNLLIFENEELVPDQTTLKASTALSIRCLDNSEGNYFLYNQNGKLINEGLGKGYTRYFKPMYQGAEITNDIGTINWIKWYFPKVSTNCAVNKAQTTMLNITQSMYTPEEINENYYSYRGVEYVEIIRENNGEMPNLEQAYQIENYWTAQKSNNTIICRISINGVEYEAIEELHFGKAGSNGTNITFMIEFEDTNALTIGETAVVRARLYTEDDGQVGGIPAGTTIDWSWYKESDTRYITYKVDDSDSSYVTLTANADTVPNDNYFILKASYSIDNNTLEAYLPIPLKVKECAYIEGAREVIYDHQGNPSYYNDAYVAYKLEDNKYIEYDSQDWKLNYDEQLTEGLSVGYIPKLKQHPIRNNYKALSAAPFYSSGYNDKICVYLDGIWSQPLLIMQSKYDFAMLNQWDGTLDINEENGTILSTMLGAGRKNNDNTFSGVLIGDIQTGTNKEDTVTATGVYGIRNGKLAYQLKDDGTAVFGEKGRGQITLDGSSGTIKSGNYDISGEGTLIDVDQGIIHIKHNNETKIYLSPNKNNAGQDTYLSIYGKAKIPLIQIGENNYFLQSHSYGLSKGQYGTYLDLNDGTFSIKGIAGNIEFSGDNDKNLFKIIDKASQTLIEMNNDKYYLQSSQYKGVKIKTIDGYEMYNNPNTTIKNGIIEKDTFTSTVGIKQGNVYNYDGKKFTKKVFSSTSIDLISIDSTGQQKIESYEFSSNDYKKRFISYLTPQYENIKPNGLYIDLNSGLIQGYNLYLRGINEDGKDFILDSTANEFPFRIKNNFKVSWDGDLYCNTLKKLSTEGDNRDYVINIGNHFYVDQNGNAGGGTWQGNSIGVAGYSPKIITSANGTYTILSR